jgi:hypothetical protein
MRPVELDSLPPIKAERFYPGETERYGEWLFRAIELQRHIDVELLDTELRYGSKGRRHELLTYSVGAAKRLIRALKPLAGVD